MSPHLFEMDLLDRRRQEAWRRLARPDEPLPTRQIDELEFTTGYARPNLVLRAVLPLALVILLLLTNLDTRSSASPPRGPASSQLQR